MGNRNQLTWDLPAFDSFDLQRAIYGIPVDQFKTTRDEFIELLELKESGQQASPQPVPGRTHENGVRRCFVAPSQGFVPR